MGCKLISIMDASNQGRARFGLFELDLESGELRKNGRPVRLQAQPARVLALLVSCAGKSVTRQELQQHVWGENFVEFDQGLNYCISQIRAALGDKSDSPVFIETIPRQGYRFIAPVEHLKAPRESHDEQRHIAAMPGRGYHLVAPAREATNDAPLGESAQGKDFEANRSESPLPPASSSPAISPRLRRGRWPVAVAVSVAIVLAAILYYLIAGRDARPTPSVRSVAVLPFKLLGSEDEHYLGLGISDAVITKLGNLRGITVRPTRAVLKYEDVDIDPVAAGR
ncbi:MAG: winged helix-turn-helix domain-containing protein, partial [Blastocatellia bacterium]|nr:winged helix-turn-helix domain-containing protein [Blastocatellia bacterium]